MPYTCTCICGSIVLIFLIDILPVNTCMYHSIILFLFVEWQNTIEKLTFNCRMIYFACIMMTWLIIIVNLILIQYISFLHDFVYTKMAFWLQCYCLWSVFFRFCEVINLLVRLIMVWLFILSMTFFLQGEIFKKEIWAIFWRLLRWCSILKILHAP